MDVQNLEHFSSVLPSTHMKPHYRAGKAPLEGSLPRHYMTRTYTLPTTHITKACWTLVLRLVKIPADDASEHEV